MCKLHSDFSSDIWESDQIILTFHGEAAVSSLNVDKSICLKCSSQFPLNQTDICFGLEAFEVNCQFVFVISPFCQKSYTQSILQIKHLFQMDK